MDDFFDDRQPGLLRLDGEPLRAVLREYRSLVRRFNPFPTDALDAPFIVPEERNDLQTVFDYLTHLRIAGGKVLDSFEFGDAASECQVLYVRDAAAPRCNNKQITHHYYHTSDELPLWQHITADDSPEGILELFLLRELPLFYKPCGYDVCRRRYDFVFSPAEAQRWFETEDVTVEADWQDCFEQWDFEPRVVRGPMMAALSLTVFSMYRGLLKWEIWMQLWPYIVIGEPQTVGQICCNRHWT